MPSEQFFSFIMRTSCILMRWWWWLLWLWWSLLCIKPTCLIRFLLRDNETKVHFDTLSQFRANQSLFLLLKHDACLEQIPTDLTSRRLEPTIYHTGGKCANYYTNNVVLLIQCNVSNWFNNVLNSGKFFAKK